MDLVVISLAATILWAIIVIGGRQDGDHPFLALVLAFASAGFLAGSLFPAYVDFPIARGGATIARVVLLLGAIVVLPRTNPGGEALTFLEGLVIGMVLGLLVDQLMFHLPAVLSDRLHGRRDW